MTPQRIAIVTGANKGLGLGIVRQLALRYSSSPIATSAPGSFIIYLTSRDASRGEAALEALNADPALKQAKALSRHGGPVDIRYRQLDVGGMRSAAGDTDASPPNHPIVDFLRSEHGEQCLDIAVNNAGVAFDGFDHRVVTDTLATNYWNTVALTRCWLPLMKDSSTSRIVNMASAAGRLEFYSETLRDRFREARLREDGGVEQVDALMKEFKDATADDTGKHEQLGWPSRAYAVSKSGLIAVTGAIAREEAQKGFKGLINCCCPGWVVTDMTKQRGFKNVDQGAELPVMLALDDLKGVTGEYWKDGKIMEW